ncbi:MAG: VCBS repeat-containing protein [Polyangiaceae bacterium]
MKRAYFSHVASSCWLLLLASSGLGLLGCGSDSSSAENPADNTGGTSSGGSAGSSGNAGSSGSGGAGQAGSITGGSAGSAGSTAGGSAGSTGSECNPACAADQKCVESSGTFGCVPKTCADLSCTSTEVCVEATGQAGAFCKDISCTSSLDCPLDQYCNGTICVADICTAGERHCENENVVACSTDGGGFSVVSTCASITGFQSVCTETGPGQAGCTCEDDWDCAAYMSCEVGICTGTGLAPTCQIPPLPFTDVPPTIEIQWGGSSIANPNAVGSPFAKSAQVVMTPVVANLDDDNGDGLINERDFPEIIFLTFCNQTISADGVMRAVHGGGPNKGKDFFAVLGTTTWHEGDDPNVAYVCTDATLNSTAAIAVGDLDNDGVPEIVAITEDRGFSIHKNTGEQIYRSPAAMWGTGYVNPAPTLANLDRTGFAEIIIGRDVFTLEKDTSTGALKMLDHFAGTISSGTQGQGPVSCVADITGDSRQEIIGGTTVYNLPRPPAGVTKIAQCSGTYSDPEEAAFCAGKLVIAWDGQTVNGTTLIPSAKRDGFCAVADVLGGDQDAAPSPSNPL